MTLVIPGWSDIYAYALADDFLRYKGEKAEFQKQEIFAITPILPSIPQYFCNIFMSFSGEQPDKLEELLERFDHKARKKAESFGERIGSDVCLMNAREVAGSLHLTADYYKIQG